MSITSLRCPYGKIIKDAHTYGKQGYKCQECGRRYFVHEYNLSLRRVP